MPEYSRDTRVSEGGEVVCEGARAVYGRRIVCSTAAAQTRLRHTGRVFPQYHSALAGIDVFISVMLRALVDWGTWRDKSSAV